MFIALFTAFIGSSIAEGVLNVYSARQEALIKPLLDKFSEKENIKINLVTSKGDVLITRLRTEGDNTPADVLITTDAGRLYRAEKLNLLEPLNPEPFAELVPKHLRSANGFWYGISTRARVIVYAKDRVREKELSTYEDLATPKWKGRVCVRSSSNIYNQSLVSSFLDANGSSVTQQWLEGLVNNFARSPQGGDRDQIRAIASKECDVALVNHYYLALLISSNNPKDALITKNIRVHWPNQDGRGVHINVSGIGAVRGAANLENAKKLIRFLLTDENQAWYSGINHEYPIRSDIPPSPLLNSWGKFKSDSVHADTLGRLNSAAVIAMDKAGWK